MIIQESVDGTYALVNMSDDIGAVMEVKNIFG